MAEINQEFESQRFQLQQASWWADQSQRNKISLCGELELRNGLFQKNHARDCQGMGKNLLHMVDAMIASALKKLLNTQVHQCKDSQTCSL